MKTTLSASTGAKLTVWRLDDMFHARLADSTGDTQICLAVDLFEVIAELAGLDLDDSRQAEEAMQLAEASQQRLAYAPWHIAFRSEAGRPQERERS